MSGKKGRDKGSAAILWALFLAIAYIIVASWGILANAPMGDTGQNIWMKSEQTPDYHLLVTYDNPSIMSFCSIESLRAVTDGNIFVWTNSGTKIPSHLDGTFIQRLIDKEHPFSGTVFENHVFSGKYGRENVANALRLAIVSKFGGMYMDTDMVVLRDPGHLPDGVGQEQPGYYNNAAFKFQKRKSPFLAAVMDDFVRNYNGDRWSHQGPRLFTRVFEHECRSSNMRMAPMEGCPDVWDMEAFYPIYFTEIEALFSTKDLPVNNSYSLHTWNKVSAEKEREWCLRSVQTYKSTAIGRLRNAFCPQTFQLAVQRNCSIQ